MAANGLVTLTLTRANGTVLNLNNIASGNVNLFVQTRPLDLGEPVRDKVVDEVVVEIDDPTDVDLYVCSKQRQNDPDDWKGPFSLSAADNKVVLPARGSDAVPEGRYYQLKIVNTVPQQIWKLTAIELYGNLGGGDV